MKTKAELWTPNRGTLISPRSMYQILCETQSPCSASHKPETCENTASNGASGQAQLITSSVHSAKRFHIPVSGGAYTAIIDEADYPLIAGKSWSIFKAKKSKNLYAQGSDGALMHRVIAGAQKGDGLKVDHRDGNGLNNTRDNIRIGSQSHNLANQRQREGTKSGFKGVSPSGGQWKAEIGYQKKRIYIGRFPTKEEAAAAYNQKALALFGPFARLNPLPCPAPLKAA